jgi:hypothetical protein
LKTFQGNIFRSAILRWCTFVLLVLAGRNTTVFAAAPDNEIQFNRDIRPILSDKCYHCHGFDKSKRKAGLRLDSFEGATEKRKETSAIVPENPEASEAIRRILTTDEDDVMPPRDSGRKLSQSEKDLLVRWVKQGAPYEKHWAFQTPQKSSLPDLKNKRWPKNEVDHFVAAKLEAAKVKPSPETSRETLLRRVMLDLTGLPPTIEELDAFLKDKSHDGYEKVVDRLLASPRYGERMSLEWLDAARYSDSNGYQHDGTRTMWPWRDWLIKALNDNKPFDQFTVELLAGDLLPNSTTDQKLATGFHRNNMLNGEGGRHPEESRIDYVIDRVDTTATVWLGLTMACARCHDHKYDPLTQKEYYQLFAYFNNVPETGGVDGGGGMANPVMALPTSEQTEKISKLKKTISELDEKLKAAEATAQDEIKKKLEQQKKSLEQAEKSIIKTMVMAEQPAPRDAFVLIRGAWDKHGEKVAPGVPAILPPLSSEAPPNRLGLAKWLVSPENPLTARVMVNRYWEQFFGVGLVKTSEDFGVQGEWPAHKDLLDWMAAEFVRSNWNVKALHKKIVMSATYRQSSKVSPELLERDPENRLLAHGPRHRLSSLVLRDQALAISGLLKEKVGGAPVRPYQPAGIWEEMSFGKIGYKQDHGADLYRRSVYIFWRRTVGPTMLFDTSARQVCTVRLPRTNTPLQSLTTLNETAYVEAARMFAERMMLAATRPEERIRFAFRSATSRLPKSAEVKVLLRGLERLQKQYAADQESAVKLLGVGEAKRNENLDPVELAAYTGVANVVLNLDEVLNKE